MLGLCVEAGLCVASELAMLQLQMLPWCLYL